MAIEVPSGPEIASLEERGHKNYWRFNFWLGRILDRPHWKTRALILVLSISLFRAFPDYEALSTPFAQATWRDAYSLRSGRSPPGHQGRLLLFQPFRPHRGLRPELFALVCCGKQS